MSDTAWDMVMWYFIIMLIFSFIGKDITGIEKAIADIGGILLFGFFFLIKAIEKSKSKV